MAHTEDYMYAVKCTKLNVHSQRLDNLFNCKHKYYKEDMIH